MNLEGYDLPLKILKAIEEDATSTGNPDVKINQEIVDYFMDYFENNDTDGPETPQVDNLFEGEKEDESVKDISEIAEALMRERRYKLHPDGLEISQYDNLFAAENESVEDLVERAEAIMREHRQKLDREGAQEGVSAINTPVQYNYTVPEPTLTFSTVRNRKFAFELQPARNQGVIMQAPDVITLESDSDDEVMFVNSVPSVMPVIDLSSPLLEKTTSFQGPSSDRFERRNQTCRSPERQYRHSCAICLDEVNRPHSTTCGHIYCCDCIKKTIRMYKKCPTCNKSLKLSNVHPIYL